MAEWFSRLERRPVTPEVEGSSPFSVAIMPLVMRGIIFAAVAQSVERILGKDEVTSSNLVSSSKKACDSNNHRLFCFVRDRKQRQGYLPLFPCIWGLRKMGMNQQKTPSLIICPLWDARGHPHKKFFKKFFCGIIPTGLRGRCLGLSLPRWRCEPRRDPLGRSCRTMSHCSQEPARSPCPRRAARLPRRAESTRT